VKSERASHHTPKRELMILKKNLRNHETSQWRRVAILNFQFSFSPRRIRSRTQVSLHEFADLYQCGIRQQHE
jgi:hypothetical protein